MRLIDKDAILHDLENGVYPASITYALAVDIAKGLIEVASEIDAVPVVRGEWIEAKSGGMSVWPAGQVMCSVCGQRMPSQWTKMPPYCYGCGAKMK